jgi:rsbT co-antagonist protein RsbR
MPTTPELQKRVAELETELAQLKVFRQAAEAAGQGLGVTSLEGQVVYMNPALRRILGIANLEEALGHPFAPYYPPDMQQRFQTEVLPAVMQQGQWMGELALVSAGGQVTPTLENFFAICDEQGQPLFLADVIAPITERKQVEMRQEEKYRKLIETTNTGFLITDGQGNVLDANQNYVNLTGYTTLDEIKGRSVTTWFAPYEAEKNAAAVQQCLEQGFIRNLQIDYIKPDGRIILVEINATVINTETGVQVLSLVRDITERKQAEEARRESEAKYSAVVNQARDGVILVQDNFCQFVNKAMAEMLGYTPAEMENTPFIRFVAPESREMVAGRVKARLTGQEVPAFYEAKLLRQDGTVIDAELSAGIIQYRGKSADIGLIRDISERKRIETERERLQQEIIEAQQHAIAELSTPVIPIMNNVIVMPLVGSIDSLRARDVTRTLLAGINQHRAKIVILDVTGVGLMDTGVVNHLNKTIQAARLKGARTIVTGLSDSVAEAIVDLGIDWNGIETLADLQTGLVTALGRLGLKLSKV